MSADVLPLRPFTIGGSEAAAACGVDPYCSPVMLWARKTGRIPPAPESEAMLWGTLLEPLILGVVDHHGYLIHEAGSPDGEQETWSDPERPWLIGHPDAFASLYNDDGSSVEYVVDAKTTGAWNGHAWNDDGAPTAYVVQVQTYMHLTGLDHALLACLVGGQRLQLRTVERDQEAINLVLALLERFREYVLTDTPPPVDGADSTAEALRAMYPGESGATVTLDREGLRWLAEYRARDRQYQAVKKHRDEAKQALQLAMGDAEIALTPAEEVAARWTTFQRNGQPARRFTVPTTNGGEG